MVTDALGYLASLLVPLAFSMKSVCRVRLIAICSNIAFIVYALHLGLTRSIALPPDARLPGAANEGAGA